MNETAVMRKRDRLTDALEETQQLRPRATFRTKDLTAHVLHRIPGPSIGEDADVVYRNDAGMFELRNRLRFAPQPLHCFRRRDLRGQDFDGHAPAELPILPLVHDAHS